MPSVRKAEFPSPEETSSSLSPVSSRFWVDGPAAGVTSPRWSGQETEAKGANERPGATRELANLKTEGAGERRGPTGVSRWNHDGSRVT